MRFTIKRKILEKKLEIINNFIPSQTIDDIFNFVKITLNQKEIRLLSSNGITSICISIKEENKSIYNCKDGLILIKAKQFLEIVKKIPSDFFSLEVLKDDKIIEISDSDKKTSFKLKCFNKEDKFPEINFNSYEKKIIISANNFSNSIRKTFFATSNKTETNPILNAINIKLKNKIIYFTSTDSFRCARVKNKLSSGNIDFDINIPVEIVSKINNILNNISIKDEIEISTNGTKVIFKYKNIIISSNLLSDNFPNIKIFDNFNENKDIFSLKIEANTLLESLNRILILSDEERTVKLTILNDKIELFSENALGNAFEIINGFNNKKNNNFEIFFNGKYVIDAISALKNDSDDLIEFQFMSKNRPFIMKNVNDKDNSVIQVVAPLSE